MNNKTITYQGIPGSYSHIASKYLFPDADLSGKSSFKEVFDSIMNGKATKAILPIENSIIGSINEVCDLIHKNGFHIKGELNLKIDHNLLVYGNTKLNELLKVYSHTKALDQCSEFLDKHKKLTPEIFEDTAAAAAFISLKQSTAHAAIASKSAAHIYGLKILKAKMQNNPKNYTRFVIIEKTNNSKKGNKTSIVFVVNHTPGSLVSCLRPFAKKGINLTKLESRPVLGKPWNYLFYLDFEHKDGYPITNILKQVKPHTALLKKLGTYTKGETISEEYIKSI